jgi:hypothetical protein
MSEYLRPTTSFFKLVTSVWHDRQAVIAVTLAFVQENNREGSVAQSYHLLSRDQILASGAVIADFACIANDPANFVARIEHDFDLALEGMMRLMAKATRAAQLYQKEYR